MKIYFNFVFDNFKHVYKHYDYSQPQLPFLSPLSTFPFFIQLSHPPHSKHLPISYSIHCTTQQHVESNLKLEAGCPDTL